MPPFSCMTPPYLLSNRKQLGWPIRNIESERHSPNAPMLSGLNDMSEDSQKRLLKVISIYGNTGQLGSKGIANLRMSCWGHAYTFLVNNRALSQKRKSP